MEEKNESLALYEILRGYQVTQAIYVAARLKIADLLQDKTKSCNELATLTNTNAHKLYRLLRALASISIFTEVEKEVFAQTEKSKLLVSTSENAMYSYTLRCGEESYLAWSKLYDGISSEKTPFIEYFKDDYFSYLKKNERASGIFNQAMVEHTRNDLMSIMEAIKFISSETIVDIGGGYGKLLYAILDRFPQTNGILFDLKSVIEKVEKQYKNKYGNRLSFIAGSFFENVPQGADIYLLKYILHDWDDEGALKILNNCRKVIKPNGRLLIIESIVPEGNEFHASKWHDLHMLVLFNSIERTRQQFNDLFNASGFKLSNITQTKQTGLSELSIMDVIPI